MHHARQQPEAFPCFAPLLLLLLTARSSAAPARLSRRGGDLRRCEFTVTGRIRHSHTLLLLRRCPATSPLTASLQRHVLGQPRVRAELREPGPRTNKMLRSPFSDRDVGL